MKNIFLLAVLIFISLNCFGQENLIIRNSLNNNKSKTFKKDSKIEIGVLEEHLEVDSALVTKETKLIGEVKTVSDTVITILCSTTLLEIKSLNKKSTSIYTYFNTSKNESEKLKTINLSKINYVKSDHSKWSAILGTSFFTSIIIAPLISINYKTGTFNQKLYYKTALLGLSGVAVSIPISIIKGREFSSIKNKKGKFYIFSNK